MQHPFTRAKFLFTASEESEVDQMKVEIRSGEHSGSLKSESGFTLLELLVALTLAAIISLIIAQVGNDAQKMYDTTTSTVETYQKFRYAMDDMKENLSKMVPTASLEFYVDRGRTRGYWDEGEEIPNSSGPNTDGGIPDEYDEAASVFERKYEIEEGFSRPDEPIEHWNDSVYFKAPVEINGIIRMANIEYYLADPKLLEGNDSESGKIRAGAELSYSDSRRLVLLKSVRYLDFDDKNIDSSSVMVRKVVTELCSNVTDLRIEYFYDNRFDNRPGGFMNPSEELDTGKVRTEFKLIEDNGSIVKTFLYGGFRSKERTTARAGIRELESGSFKPVLFNYASSKLKFSQLKPGDKMYVWADGATSFPSGEFSVLTNSQGRIIFNESIPSSTWTGDPGGLRFRAPYVPPAFRISLRVLNEKGEEPRTLTSVIKTNN